MTKNPLINASAAALYVAAVGLIPYIGSKIAEVAEPKETIFGPIAFLSLFTLSAALMAFLFFYEPISLLTEGKKAEALTFLLHTIGYFALITCVVFVAVLITAL